MESTPEKPDQNSSADDTPVEGIMWWAMMVVAVLAVPSFGIVASALTPVQQLGDFGQIIVFILSCWLCTYLGMKIMQGPNMNKKIKRK